jgi:hypothetical protein
MRLKTDLNEITVHNQAIIGTCGQIDDNRLQHNSSPARCARSSCRIDWRKALMKALQHKRPMEDRLEDKKSLENTAFHIALRLI